METMLGRTQAGDFRLDLHSVGNLGERDGAAHVIALSGMQYGDSF